MDQNEHPSAPTTLDSLPDELLVLISEHLPHPLDGTVIASMKDRGTLARLCRVSKRWRDVVQPVLWRHVVVNSGLAIRALVAAKKSHRELVNALMVWEHRPFSMSAVIADLARAVANVESLQLITPFFEKRPRPIQLSDLSIFGALRSLHLHGVHVDLNSVPTFPNLTELALVCVSTTASIDRLFESNAFPSLRCLHVVLGLQVYDLRNSLPSRPPPPFQSAFSTVSSRFPSQLDTLQTDGRVFSADANILTQPSPPILVMLSLSTLSLAPIPPGISHIELYDFPDFCRTERGVYTPSLPDFEAYLVTLGAYIEDAASSPHPVLSLSAPTHFLAPDTFRRARTAFAPVRTACAQHGVALRFVPDGRLLCNWRGPEARGALPLVRGDFARWWARVQVERAMHMMDTVRLGA
ncbi:hypothetical protein JCM10450v2_003373 [Rhodotorula kratochvilovae]